MSLNYAKTITNVPQSEAIPGKDMVKNNAGGYVFQVSKWDFFTRFLILGTEGGTYYVQEKKMTIANAKNAIDCIKEDPKKALELILDVSLKGRAVKQNPTIFALALLANETKGDDTDFNKELKAAVTKVCRTSTMLFMYLSYVKELRGLGPSVRKSIARFYESLPVEQLDMNLVKYREREGFTHRDVMRLVHPKTKDAKRNDLFKWAVGKAEAPAGTMAATYEQFKTLDHTKPADLKTVIAKIEADRLPREILPTPFLNVPEVWKAMLAGMPLTALIRNLGKMSSLEIFKSNLIKEVDVVVKKLTDAEYIRRSRIHPLQVLQATKVYGSGRGVKGGNTWQVNSKIMEGLDKAMELSYANVEPTGLRFLVGMDVSGSMDTPVLGMDNLSAYEASAAYVSILNRIEPNVDIVAFGSQGGSRNYSRTQNFGWTSNNGRENGLTVMDVPKTERIDKLLKRIKTEYYMGSGTDCALPMIYALEKKIPVDVFIITTDNESWAGTIHASQALKNYRKAMGINAKLIVLATAATSYTIADPTDSGMLDIAGFDPSVTQVVNEFIKG